MNLFGQIDWKIILFLALAGLLIGWRIG